jgi:hypothetical protein
MVLKHVEFLKGLGSVWLCLMFVREAGVKLDFDMYLMKDIERYFAPVEPRERGIFPDCNRFVSRNAVHDSTARVFDEFKLNQGGLTVWYDKPASGPTRLSARFDGRVKKIRGFQVLFLPVIVLEALFGCFVDCEFVVLDEETIEVHLPEWDDARKMAANVDAVRRLRNYGRGLKCEAVVTSQRITSSDRGLIDDVVMQVLRLLRDEEREEEARRRKEEWKRDTDRTRRSFGSFGRKDDLAWDDMLMDG